MHRFEKQEISLHKTRTSFDGMRSGAGKYDGRSGTLRYQKKKWNS
jgi:hypothetical protein